jgi:hypothetical protein
MRTCSRYALSLLFAAVLTAPIMITGCNGEVRVYDPYYHDYHVWNNDEVVYYNRWETENHYPHVDYKHRKADQQHAYWDWRHQQEHH